MQSKGESKSEETRDSKEEKSKVFQILESQAPQIEMSKHRSRKREEEKQTGSVCDQSTKGTAKEEAGTLLV